ncbi:MAG: phosphonate metabolism protein/1,5-bisphosphokinase (PRPP-forming) PhnN [Betaproteobacteria bacterium HGW-Betaproteobacteria-17]|jgi:ribose 1,5-bisphosphokinase|nr:MAG: phosphonate metabolism protein/1,5-bisphosphokinase (PRPP-forming) PhnN [Betaproteobacteria bacterium HGW-Betaproteobacteria-17]
MAEGKLFYVIGPSGSGKDSLMRYARARLADNPGVVFAHRYITRPVELQGENHIALTETEFDSRLAAGLFAMHWSSHGLRYGIGREIDVWLTKGCNVVMNGSREYLQQAREHYPELAAVWVEVSSEVLKARLQARGRENATQIAARVARAAQFRLDNGGAYVVRNDGPLEQAGEQLRALIGSKPKVASCA